MKLNFRRTPPGVPLWELRTTNTDDIRTIYFALIEYRSNLHKSLETAITGSLDQDDYVVDPNTPLSCGCCTLKDALEHIDPGQNLVSNVVQVHTRTLLDSCDEFEELTFLYETLYKVNNALFEIVQNHSKDLINDVRRELDV